MKEWGEGLGESRQGRQQMFVLHQRRTKLKSWTRPSPGTPITSDSFVLHALAVCPLHPPWPNLSMSYPIVFNYMCLLSFSFPRVILCVVFMPFYMRLLSFSLYFSCISFSSSCPPYRVPYLQVHTLPLSLSRVVICPHVTCHLPCLLYVSSVIPWSVRPVAAIHLSC